MIFLLIVLLLLSFLVLYKKFTAPRHPFTPKPLVTPPSHKTDISKQLYSTKQGTVPQDLDAIVIGSGIGGLTIAALLSKQGRRVLVLEQHDVAGGCCHTFEDNGFEFDTGIHYVGNLDPKKRGASYLILDYITGGKSKWESMGDVYDCSIIGDQKIEWNRDNSKTFAELKKRYPNYAKQLDNYLKLVNKIYFTSGSRFVMKVARYKWLGDLIFWWYGAEYKQYYTRTTKDVLKNDFGFPEDLIAQLCYLYGNHGAPPEKSPFTIHCIVSKHYQRSGGYYPVGSPAEIARSIIPQIESRGGRVLVKCSVSKILTKNNRAIGVETHKGQKIYAPLVISSVGVFNTFAKLVDPKLSEKFGYLEKLKNAKQGATHFYLFLGMNKSPKELNLPKYNFWVHPNKNFDSNLLKYKETMDFNYTGCFISFPCTKDPTFEKRFPNKSTCIVVCEANYEWVKKYENLRVKQRGNEYNDLKKKVMVALEEKTYKVLPQIKDYVVFKDVATPVTNSFYLGSAEGTSYGIDYVEENADWIRARTEIENLYLTGQDVCSMGFAGAIGGAVITYTSITGEDIMKKLKK